MSLLPRLSALALAGLTAALAAAVPRSQDAGGAPEATAEEAPAGSEEAPAALAGEGEVAVLRFEIRDESGQAMPGRLTFVPEEGGALELFPNVKARPLDLAVRKNVVYTLSGTGAITVPPGRYALHVSRGLEWATSVERIELRAGEEHRTVATLRRGIDSTGWISADFHLHTLTYSGHGDADLEERIVSIVGEGVEFAVATDHNHHTDYAPTIEQLGAGKELTSVTGNEISTPIGHMNAFPLEPDRPVPDPEATDANALFKLVRAEPNRFGVTPIVQINHPRWRHIDYFTLTGLDPVTGESTSATYSSDFDTVEVLNANAGWGYHEADLDHEFSIGPGIHSALSDWFHLLNRGQRVFAVGNSDSHTVLHDFAGYPRNFVQSSTDDPGSIDPAEVARALREGRSFATTGPFVEFRVNDAPMGSTVNAGGRGVRVQGRFQSAPWIRLDRVHLVVNGVKTNTFELKRGGGPNPADWNELETVIDPRRDYWVCLLVEGDQPLDPIVTGAPRPVLPIAVTNPIWVDADGNGIWTSPWDRALALVADCDDLRMLRLKGTRMLPAVEEALYPLAAAQARRSYATYMAREALGKFPRGLRLSGARAAEILGDASLVPDLERVFPQADDPYLCIALLRAMKACRGGGVGPRVMELFERFGGERVGRYAHELGELLPGRPVVEWRVLGYFDGPGEGSALETARGPETDADADAHAGKGGVEARWTSPTVSERGYVDLRAIDPERAEQATAYARTWLHAPEELEVAYAIGTDDGCRLWIGDELLHEDARRRGADPLQHLGRVKLAAGWNRVLVKVENGTGDFGLYFRVLDDRVRAAAEPR